MFDLGLPEILVIGAAALLLFGPKRLPELAKSLGKGIRDFKKALEEEEPKQSLPPAATTVQQTPQTEAKKDPVASGDSGQGSQGSKA